MLRQLPALLLCALTAVSMGSGRISDSATSESPVAESEIRPDPMASMAVIIPNVDDDDGDGIADFEAAPTPSDDDLLRVVVQADTTLPAGAVLRTDVPKAWTGLIKVFAAGAPGGTLRPVQASLALDDADRQGGRIALAIEAGAFAGPGRPRAIEIGVRFETRDGAPVSARTVTCTVAPFLVSSCLDPADSVHVVRTTLTESFVRDLKPLVEQAHARLLAFEHPALRPHDIWFQDATEIGYAAAGDRLMHVALHGNRGELLDDLFAKAFLRKDSGVVHEGRYRGRSAEWIDWFGNLEVSPPLAVGGRAYPNGRVYTGRQGTRAMHPDVIGFLEAQGAQGPILWLDTSWLLIGHVDETVSWVPSRVGTPFRMLVPSPRLALEILQKAEKDAPGCILNRGTRRPDSGKGELLDVPVATALRDRAVLAGQQLVQAKIDAVRRTLQAELGIADDDIVEIPVLFSTPPGRFAGRYEALTTNMVNSLLVGDTLIVPDPHGPLVNGTDVLLQAVRDRLEPLGCRVVAVDNFYPYHRFAGEVHCGTNVTRRPRTSALPHPAAGGLLR